MCMISTLPAWPKCQGLVVVAVPDVTKARLTLSNYHLPPLPAWDHVESSSVAPASVQCSLHQLTAGRPNFNHLLSLSMLFIGFQSGRLFLASSHYGLLLLP